MTMRRWTKHERRRLELLRSACVPSKAIAGILDRTDSAVQREAERYKWQSKRHIFATLDLEVVNWLCSITQPGSSMAETVKSIIQDAYANETQ